MCGRPLRGQPSKEASFALPRKLLPTERRQESRFLYPIDKLAHPQEPVACQAGVISPILFRNLREASNFELLLPNNVSI